jgi:hypothetical protein
MLTWPSSTLKLRCPSSDKATLRTWRFIRGWIYLHLLPGCYFATIVETARLIPVCIMVCITSMLYIQKNRMDREGPADHTARRFFVPEIKNRYNNFCTLRLVFLTSFLDSTNKELSEKYIHVYINFICIQVNFACANLTYLFAFSIEWKWRINQCYSDQSFILFQELLDVYISNLNLKFHWD